MTENTDIGPVAKDIFVMSKRNDMLRALLTERSPGAADICRQQSELLDDLKSELEAVKRGKDWWRLNDLLGQAHNVDPIVGDMIESIQHPELAKQSRDWADENLP